VLASDFGFHSELVDQSRHPMLRVGETSAPIMVKLMNTGTRAWVRGKADQQLKPRRRRGRSIASRSFAVGVVRRRSRRDPGGSERSHQVTPDFRVSGCAPHRRPARTSCACALLLTA